MKNFSIVKNWKIFFACGASYALMFFWGWLGFPLISKTLFFIFILLAIINFIFTEVTAAFFHVFPPRVPNFLLFLACYRIRKSALENAGRT